MYETLFAKKATVARHESAPYAEERWRYLEHCEREGYSPATLRVKACDLLWIAIKLSAYPNLQVNTEQIEAVATDWKERQRATGHKLDPHWARARFVATARLWLRFLGCLVEPTTVTPFAQQVHEYVEWMNRERGLATRTVEQRRRYVEAFLRWCGARGVRLLAIRPENVDEYLAEGGRSGWGRVYIKGIVGALRDFFRYGAHSGWCCATLHGALQGPRVYALEQLPTFPKWSEIRHLLSSMDTDSPGDIRDRSILMLFAIYGLRASEVAHLRLEDLDWDRDAIWVSRAKRSRLQQYPLIPTVGNAIARYLEEVRPPSRYREVFLRALAPIRPLSRFGLHSLTQKRLAACGIGGTHQGPHALRHACAARLVSEGLSLKEIGDHLGHRSSSSTRIYAKVDLAGLREVAAFDLGDVL